MQLIRRNVRDAGRPLPPFGAVGACGNPMDVTPAAMAVHQRILDVLPLARAAGKKVMVVFGENHNIPTHIGAGKAALDLTIQSLGGSGRVAVNLEARHDLLPVLLAPHLLAPRPLLEWTALNDPLGHRHLKTLLGYGQMMEAPVTRADFYAYLLEQKLSARFVDAAAAEDKDGQPHLNLMDDLTRRMVVERRDGAPRSLDIHVVSPEGVADRNFMMAVLSGLHMNETGADVGFVFCGNNHVIGNAEEGLALKDSLSQYLADAGYMVVPVYNQHYLGALESIPKEAAGLIGQGVILRGLDPSIYEAGDELSEEFHFEDVCMSSSAVLKPTAVPDAAMLRDEVMRETIVIAKELLARNAGHAFIGPHKKRQAPRRTAAPEAAQAYRAG